jgi:glyoxylase-like metal-dependent hydrolase (beta-lactamase superfamily II)
MRFVRLLFVLTVGSSVALLWAQQAGPGDLFELKPVVPGVWAAIAKPAYKINCNAVVVELDDAVLVVDTHSKPSAARALTELIKARLNKPVKYVVDSHFHWDHSQGNEAYPTAWPQGVEIISHEATRESIETRGIPRIRRQVLDVPKEIEALKADLAKAAGNARRADIQSNLAQAESYLAELKAMGGKLPTLTLDRSLVLHARARTVQILFMGKAHTDGDVFVYLPRERFIATGDALHGWTPYMNDSHPFDWIRTLKAVEQLDYEYSVGGHGDIMRGKTMNQMWQQYFTDLIAETTAAYTAGATMQQAVTRVSASLVPKYTGRMPATFKDDVPENIRKVFRVVSGEMQ